MRSPTPNVVVPRPASTTLILRDAACGLGAPPRPPPCGARPPRGRRNTWGGPAFVSHEAVGLGVGPAPGRVSVPGS